MNKLQIWLEKWQVRLQERHPAVEKLSSRISQTGTFLKVFVLWAYKLRSLFLSIPVIVGAMYLAVHNMQKLPASVGINLQANGEYAMMMDRGVAVLIPLAITGFCLGMMYLSRRIFYPWIISVFSLTLPVLIYITNVFPG